MKSCSSDNDYTTVPQEVFPIFHSEAAFTQNKLPSSKQIYFTCNTSRKDDSKSYTFGGLSKCMEDGAGRMFTSGAGSRRFEI